ncbi:MAG TPA: hypothetical protein VEH82_01545 [Acidimicrobiales bacterium]|nr:hypothetical protein [Acidimicrobiales bacterium]
MRLIERRREGILVDWRMQLPEEGEQELVGCGRGHECAATQQRRLSRFGAELSGVRVRSGNRRRQIRSHGAEPL